MSQKEKQEGNPGEEKVAQRGGQPLSQTITDAHASGDGALERGKDTLIASDDDGGDDKKESSNGDAY